MDSDRVVTVEVTVSEELRRLLARMRDDSSAMVPGSLVTSLVETAIAPTAKLASRSEPAKPDPSFWSEIILRRDGQRPIMFRGLPVLSRSCSARVAPGSAEQRLTVYLAEGDLLYASLVFEPPNDACAHPSHRCQPIRDKGEFELFLKDWRPELCFETVFASGAQNQQNLSAGQAAVRSAFNSMAADCLCTGVLHS